VRSLKNKIDSFYNASSSSTYDFICITESWLIDSISSSEFIDINKYSVIRRDRDLTATNSSRGGGVLLAYNNTLAVEEVDLSGLRTVVPHIEIIGCNYRFNPDYR
jgi:hypothetical protein